MTWDDLLEVLPPGTFSGTAVRDLDYERGAIGRLPSAQALHTFQIRQRTVEQAQVPVEGLNEMLRKLGDLAATEHVLLFHLVSPTDVVTVFVREEPFEYLAEIRVPKLPARTRV